VINTYPHLIWIYLERVYFLLIACIHLQCDKGYFIRIIKRLLIALTVFTLFLTQANAKQTLRVTASAYTSHKNQTQGDPTIGAWGHKLKPGVKTIAVSRDLLRRGLKNGTKVTIDGLKGTFIVRDKMHYRWHKKIDIYMGYDRQRALNWGKRKVVIRWG